MPTLGEKHGENDSRIGNCGAGSARVNVMGSLGANGQSALSWLARNSQLSGVIRRTSTCQLSMRGRAPMSSPVRCSGVSAASTAARSIRPATTTRSAIGLPLASPSFAIAAAAS